MIKKVLKLFGKLLNPGTITVILGAKWGDEGKGKIAEYAAKCFDLIVRFNGGPNAGHHTSVGALHQIPCGISNLQAMNLLANDVVIDIQKLLNEIKTVSEKVFNLTDRLFISEKATIITPVHILMDYYTENAGGANAVGSTKSGIAYVYASISRRNFVRVRDIVKNTWQEKYANQRGEFLELYPGGLDELEKLEKFWKESFEDFKKLNFISCASDMVSEYLRDNKLILAEGAQGVFLDPVWGHDKFVTSSRIGPGAVANSLGVGVKKIDRVILVAKAFTSRVGDGPFPTEFGGTDSADWCKTNTKESEESLDISSVPANLQRGILVRKKAGEYGATTGRPRRTGAIDIPLLARAVELTGADEIIITFTDFFLDEETVPVCFQHELIDKTKIGKAPDDMDLIKKAIITELPAWRCELSLSSSHDENLKSFIMRIKEHIHDALGGLYTPCISAISYGPEMEAVCDISY